MNKLSPFKIGVFAVFIGGIIIGVALFALSKGTTSSTSNADIVVWGTIDESAFSNAYGASSIKGLKSIRVSYVKKSAADFDQDFIGALADGVGPDIVILRDDSFYKNRKKIYTIPYKSYPARTFKDTFIEEGELFMSPEGIEGIPFMIDPLVLYWNRDIFSNNIIPQPPKYWDEIYPLINQITKKDSNANIMQTAIALGEWRNVVNAKEILSMILMQAGTPITERSGTNFVSTLSQKYSYTVAPADSGIDFFTQFSNPTSVNYTWNRSLPSSLNMFLSGNLATYIGFASEIQGIQQKNSNLNFDVTYVPQIRNSNKKIVFGHMYLLSIVKQSKQASAAFSVIAALTEPASIKSLEQYTNLPPVRRDLLADRPTDAYKTVFYDSALLSHAWIDPDSVESNTTFRDMIESITGGKSRSAEAIYRAEQELSAQLKK